VYPEFSITPWQSFERLYLHLPMEPIPKLPTEPATNLPGNTKGGSITVPLTSLFDWLGFVSFANKNKIFSCHTADSKPVKQEVNGTVILPPLVFPEPTHNKNRGYPSKLTAIESAK
jgi:hypothetical protein